MKKVLSILMMLAFALGCAFSAQAAAGDVTLIRTDVDDPDAYRKSVISIAAEGDALYVLMEDRIDVLKAGETALAPYITGLTTSRNLYDGENADFEHAIGLIFAQNGQLVCVNTRWGSVFTLAVGADGQPVYGEAVELDFGEEIARRDEDNSMPYLEFSFDSCALSGNTLYVSGYDDNGGEQLLFAFDTATGAQRKLNDLSELRMMGAYRDGKLLVIAGDPETFYDSEKGEYIPWPLRVYDPESGEASEIARIDGVRYYDVRALCYDEKTNVVYMVIPNRIYRIAADGACELAAYHPYTGLYSEGANAQAFDGRLAVFDNNGNMGLFVCDPAQLPSETVSIANFYANDTHQRAAVLMPDIPIFFTRDNYYSTAQELGQALAAGESQLDIISVDLSWIDYARLTDKGYCYDLSGSAVLMDYVKAIYPVMSDSVLKGGALYGIPVEMYGSYWMYNTVAFDALGLTPPTTWAELVEMMNDFASEEHEDWWEEYSLFEDEGSYKASVFYQCMSAYEQYMLASGKTLSLDTPEFRAMMQAVEQIDTENVEVLNGWDDETGEPNEELEALWNKTPLLRSWGDLQPAGDDEYNRKWQPLKIAISEEAGFQIPANVRVLFVNPRSKNLNAAVQYLENYVQSLSQREKTLFMPDVNEPIENKYYESNLQDMQASVERQKKQLEAADPIDKPALQENLDIFLGYIEEFRENGRYEVSPQAIARYRDLMQYVVLQRPSVMYSNSNDDSFWTLRNRYVEGQITLEQFIQEGSGKLRLMQMEGM